MTDDILVKKTKEKIGKNEAKLQKQIEEVGRIWEDTGLDPKDPSYLIEKTMRFEMAQETINRAFLLANETISDYKKLCSELEKQDNSE
ncbi:MAG TPA: hypothetical protein VJ571_05560 [Candidatus Nitrosotalea sp.]|nr:hypothetical protein [Candidatus Nitrosotalea sp.]